MRTKKSFELKIERITIIIFTFKSFGHNTPFTMQDKRLLALRVVSTTALVFLCFTLTCVWFPVMLFGGVSFNYPFFWFLLLISFPFFMLFLVVPYVLLVGVLGAASILGIKGAKTNSRRGLLWSSILGFVGSAFCFAEVFVTSRLVGGQNRWSWPDAEKPLPWALAFGSIRALLFLGVGVCAIMARPLSKSKAAAQQQMEYQKLTNVKS